MPMEQGEIEISYLKPIDVEPLLLYIKLPCETDTFITRVLGYNDIPDRLFPALRALTIQRVIHFWRTSLDKC